MAWWPASGISITGATRPSCSYISAPMSAVTNPFSERSSARRHRTRGRYGRALDLSGHGDSDHRPGYSLAQWTEEVMAVADAGGVDGPPVIIGHSMGGFVTIATAALHPDRLAGAIVCDSPVAAPDPEVNAAQLGSAFGVPRTYATLEAALARFRTVPPQDHYLDYVVDHVARHSARRVEGGWQWKFDRRIFEQFAGGMRGIALPYLQRVRCRFALLRNDLAQTSGLVESEDQRNTIGAMVQKQSRGNLILVL